MKRSVQRGQGKAANVSHAQTHPPQRRWRCGARARARFPRREPVALEPPATMTMSHGHQENNMHAPSPRGNEGRPQCTAPGSSPARNCKMQLALPVSGTALTGAGRGTRLPGFGARSTPTPRRLREHTCKHAREQAGQASRDAYVVRKDGKQHVRR